MARKVVFSSFLAVLLVASIFILVRPKTTKAETIYFTNTYNFQLREFFSAPTSSGSWNVEDSYGAPMQFYFLDKYETQYDTLQFYLQVQIDTSMAYVRFFNNDEFQGTPLFTITYLKSNGYYRTYQNFTNIQIQQQVFGNIRSNPYDKEGKIVSNTFDTESTSYQLFTYFVDIKKTERLEFIDEFNKGEQEGREKGILEGIETAQKDPHSYNLYTLDDLNAKFNEGVISGRDGIGQYSNVLSVAWDSCTTLLNTKVLGDITILEIISIPIMLGVFLIILKLIRG